MSSAHWSMRNGPIVFVAVSGARKLIVNLGLAGLLSLAVVTVVSAVATPVAAQDCQPGFYIYFSPCPQTVSAGTNAGGQTLFGLFNGNFDESISLSCVPDGVVTSCSAPSWVFVPSGQTVSFEVSYTTGPAAGTGGIRVSTNRVGENASARYTVTVSASGVTVTPDGGAITASAFSSNTQSFDVGNTGGDPATFTLTTTCSGTATSCQVSPSIAIPGNTTVQVPVTYSAGDNGTTGEVRLRATHSTLPSVTDEGWRTVTASWPSKLTVSTDFNNNDLQSVGLCVNACFAATARVSTVPYFSLDRARSVTLVYNGDRVALRPFIVADVSVPAGTTVPSEYWLQVKDSASGAFLPFLNGDANRIRYTGTADSVRLAGQIDASTVSGWNGTGVRPIQIIVTAIRGSVPEIRTIYTQLLIVDERKSPVARGWTIAGVARLYGSSGAPVVITHGDGSATRYSFGYCSGGICFYNASSGDFTRLTYNQSATQWTWAHRDSTKYRFNNLGHLLSIADRFNVSVVFSYDGAGRLVSIRDPIRLTSAGHPAVDTLVYNSYGLAYIQEPGPGTATSGGRITYVSVAGDSTLRAFKDPGGDSTAFGYDGLRRLTTITDRRDATTQLVYDPVSWKVVRMDLPSVQVDQGGGTEAPASPSIQYRPWQTVGIPTTPTSSTPATPARIDTIEARITDAGGHTVRTRVDRWGQPLVVKDELNNTTTIQRTGLFPTTVTYPTGAVDQFSYDGLGFLLSSQPAGSDVANYQYDGYSQVSRISGPNQPTQDFFRSGVGRLDSVKVAGLKTSFLYDALGRIIRRDDAGAHYTLFHYDAIFGNLDSTTAHSSTQPRRFAIKRFDGYGRDSVVRTSGAPQRRVIYDALNRVRQAYDGVHPAPTTYSYDSLFLTQVQDPAGQVYRWDVNALGWKTREYDPVDPVNRYLSYRYNVDGLLTSYTNRRGQRVDLTYDAIHRLRSKGGPANVVADSFNFTATGSVTVGWNAISRDSIFVNATGWTDSAVTRFAIDPSKRFRRYYRADSQQRLDSIGFHTTTSIPFTARRYRWSATTGALSSIELNGTPRATIGYNSEMLPSTVTWPGNLTRTTSYTTAHAPYSIGFNNSAVHDALSRGYGYEDSVVARMTEVSRPSGANTKTQSFRFDGMGRLDRLAYSTITPGSCPPPPNPPDDGYICAPLPTTTPDSVFLFRYDSVGNLREQKDSLSGATIAGTYTTGNRISTWGGTTYTPDLDGNVATRTTSGVTTTFTWTADGRLASVVVGGQTLAYEYNAFRELVRRSRNGAPERYFLWDQGHLLMELDGTASTRIAEYAYFPGTDEPLVLITGPAGSPVIREVQQDATGNVIGVLSGTSLAQEIDYRPWGSARIVAGTVADTNRLRWKGLLWEADTTKLYYVRNRWYDPESRRFISEDPIGLAGGINAYVYAENDPINRTDPFGLFSCNRVQLLIYDDSGGEMVVTSTSIRVCGGGGASKSVIGQILDALAKYGVGSGAGWYESSARPPCGGGFPVNLCPILNAALVHLRNSETAQCNDYGQLARNALRDGRLRWDGDLWAGAAYNDGRNVFLGPIAFRPRPSWTHAELAAAVAGSTTHEFGHIRYPGMNNRDHDFGRGDTPHDFIYRQGIMCAEFDYL